MKIGTILIVVYYLLPGIGQAAKSVSPGKGPQSASIMRTNALTDSKDKIILQALASLGTKYQYGSANPRNGLDCSGLVLHVFKKAAGLMLPHNAYSLSLQGKAVPLTDLRPGDLVFFNTSRRGFSHVGIYVGDSVFIHAPCRGKYVQFASLDDAYWEKRFNGARRIIDRPPPQQLSGEFLETAPGAP